MLTIGLGRHAKYFMAKTAIQCEVSTVSMHCDL